MVGFDIDMEFYVYINYLQDFVEFGVVSEFLVDDVVCCIFCVKYKLGLFEDLYWYCNEEWEEVFFYNEVYQEVVLDMVKKLIVLFKNEGNLFFLKKEGFKIILIGQFVNDKISFFGSWCIGFDDGIVVFVLEGFFVYEGNEVIFVEGLKFWANEFIFVIFVEVNIIDWIGMVEVIEAV